jgi:uncharacterized protein (DUF488 family)
LNRRSFNSKTDFLYSNPTLCTTSTFRAKLIELLTPVAVLPASVKIGKYERMKLWTIGHSTRSSEDLQTLLKANSIRALVDVRSFPGSRRNPQFNRSQLECALEASGIEYHHLPNLGGLRTPSPSSRNTGLKNPSFRGYADHMESQEFEKGIDELLKLAEREVAVIMCAEALWWNCHRSMISDYLKSIDFEVIHILDTGTQPHSYSEGARIVEGRLTYRGLFD